MNGLIKDKNQSVMSISSKEIDNQAGKTATTKKTTRGLYRLKRLQEGIKMLQPFSERNRRPWKLIRELSSFKMMSWVLEITTVKEGSN